jgi:AN1-type zinc finger protein 5/6
MINRCTTCNKKVGLIPFTCKCDDNFKFCSKHRLDHDCTFDYKKEQLKKLIKDNPKIVAPKTTLIN